MLKANLYRLRQCILTWDCLVPLTMLALVRQANGLCQTQRYWLLCSQGLEYGLCFELLRSALQVPVDGRLSIGSTNRSARLRDQPKHSEFLTSLVTTVQLSSSMGWLARVVAACRYKPTSLDGLTDHHAVAAQLQCAAKAHTGYHTTG